MPSFVCQECQREFQIPEETLRKYPGWQPKTCLACKKRAGGGGGTAATSGAKAARRPPPRAGRSAASAREEDLTCAEVLAKYHGGPLEGVFTDGAADPNPGPGGWGAVYVRDNQMVSERTGHEPHTTNNRMELVALIAGCALAPVGIKTVVYSDSELCVKTINEWAKGWEARGWQRRTGPIKNLELVQEAFGIFKRRPELELRWIAAHAGNRWNEYADALATAYRRSSR